MLPYLEPLLEIGEREEASDEARRGIASIKEVGVVAIGGKGKRREALAPGDFGNIEARLGLRQNRIVASFLGLSNGNVLAITTIQRIITDARREIDLIRPMHFTNAAQLHTERLPDSGIVAIDGNFDPNLASVGNIPTGAPKLRVDQITAGDGFIARSYHGRARRAAWPASFA